MSVKIDIRELPNGEWLADTSDGHYGRAATRTEALENLAEYLDLLDHEKVRLRCGAKPAIRHSWAVMTRREKIKKRAIEIAETRCVPASPNLGNGEDLIRRCGCPCECWEQAVKDVRKMKGGQDDIVDFSNRNALEEI